MCKRNRCISQRFRLWRVFFQTERSGLPGHDALTRAQRSSTRGSSDARFLLLCSSTGGGCMHTTVIPWREDNPAVFLSAYLLESSPEFQTGNRRPSVVVCPGTGYFMTSDREAEPVALRFLARGYHAFVVRYSVRARFPEPMLDLARAMLTIREHADEWLVDPDQLTVCGFSAGGHLAASLGVFWDKPWLHDALGVGGDQIRPAALILGYPVIDIDLVSDRQDRGELGDESVPANEAIYSVVLGEGQPAREIKDRYRLELHVSAATPPAFL